MLATHKTVKHCKLAIVLLACYVSGLQAQNQDQWWFEIEAILFERNVTPEDIEENFPVQVTPISVAELPDFIGSTLLPDFDFLRQGAEICLSENNEVTFPAQTVELPIIYDVFDDEDLARLQQNQSKAVSQSLLSESLMHDSEWIAQTKPSELWQNQLAQFLSVQDDEYTSWRTRKLSPQSYLIQSSQEQQVKLTQIPQQLYCQWPVETTYFSNKEARALQTTAFLPYIPKTIDGIELPYSNKPYTLPGAMLQLKQLRRDIDRTSGLNVLLHTAWRQNVVTGRDNAPWYRIYAGENLSRQYHYTGLPKRTESNDAVETAKIDVFQQIREILQRDEGQQIQQETIPEQLLELQNSALNDSHNETWTLDGRLKVFIEYLGRTPYLHLDSEFNYRAPVYIDWQNKNSHSGNSFEQSQQNNELIAPAPNFLQAYHFDQIRRMISTEIHYFDHPLFGMVVQIRRYQRPSPPEPENLQ